jgi:hypothetical protein
MEGGGEVWLETPWPSVYWDLVERGLKLAPVRTPLRTQRANAEREVSKYHGATIPERISRHRIWYTHEHIRKAGGFLAAMCRNSGVPTGDFSFPVPSDWIERAKAWLLQQGWHGGPLMLYRPLVDRTEWDGCRIRNPDGGAYVALARFVSPRFFVVSIADTVPQKEWITSESIGADVECHKGELPFEMLAALAKLSSLVFCSPGFALVLAQAVGAPLAAVFGGHECGRLYSHGSPLDLLIDPIRPCECFRKDHPCDKRIDIEKAKAALEQFCSSREIACG